MSFDTAAIGAVPLYDATSGVQPEAPPWFWDYGELGSGTTRSMLPSAFVLDTTSSTGPASYGTTVSSGLDSSAGFAIDFSLRVATESHSSNDRSGFSMLVLDQSTRGVELSFWTDQVWAKNADKNPDGSYMTHGEWISVDTQTATRSYRLTFLGGQYSLSTAGALPLVGALRYYVPVVSWPYNWVPYGQSNYVVFGDNTSSGSALAEIGAITLAPVPEPSEWALMLAGLACIGAAIRSQRRSPTWS